MPGVIIGVQPLVMKTDGLIAEALLGKSAALDEYALKTQIEVLKKKALENNRTELGMTIIQKLLDGDKANDAASAFRKCFIAAKSEMTV